MLPFASITSIIPLFVLAFVYLGFFGANALANSKTDTEPVMAQAVKSAEARSSEIEPYYFYFIYPELFDTEKTSDELIVHPRVITVNKVFPGSHQEVIKTGCPEYSIFNRPPPHLPGISCC